MKRLHTVNRRGRQAEQREADNRASNDETGAAKENERPSRARTTEER